LQNINQTLTRLLENDDLKAQLKALINFEVWSSFADIDRNLPGYPCNSDNLTFIPEASAATIKKKETVSIGNIYGPKVGSAALTAEPTPKPTYSSCGPLTATSTVYEAITPSERLIYPW
jgi:hypothetical protein